MWIADFVKLYEEGRQLPYPEVMAVRASLPADRSFQSYAQALAHITGPPLPHDTNLIWEEGLLDVAFTFPIQSEHSRFAISPGLTRLAAILGLVESIAQGNHPEERPVVRTDGEAPHLLAGHDM